MLFRTRFFLYKAILKRLPDYY